MSVLTDLIAKGFFPVQLPPGFSSEEFSNAVTNIREAWKTKNLSRECKLEKFSVARSSYYRRAVKILNPAAYYYLAETIETYWDKIETHYALSEISLSTPKIEPGLRAIKINKFSELYEEKITRASGYRFVLITDIASFFPSIYTHSIPWALHKKEIAKKHRRPTAQYYGNKLDASCMAVQDGQTIGIPIGPDTSHIIAEIIGVAIDIQLKAALKTWPAGFRYVDDYYLFFEERSEAEKCLAQLTKAITNFELQVNAAKTRIVEVKELVEENWKYNLKELTLSSKRGKQKNDIHNFFERLFSLESKYTDESIIKYGLKQISSNIIRKSNWKVFEAYLLKCGFSYPNTLQIIAQLLSTYNQYGYQINKSAIKRFCDTLIKTHAISDHHGEVSWLLWICKDLEIKIDINSAKEIQGMSSAVCTLILLDMQSRNLAPDVLTKPYLEQYAKADALNSDGWLLAYEAGRRLWLKNADHNYINEHDHFKDLLDENVSFYDPDVKCSPIFKLKQQDFDFGLFDSDEDIESNFDFDDMHEEYFDKSSED